LEGETEAMKIIKCEEEEKKAGKKKDTESKRYREISKKVNERIKERKGQTSKMERSRRKNER
jgi:hypothetical protein